MELCNELGALYIDTVNEPWVGFYFDSKLGPERARIMPARGHHGGQAQAQARQHHRGVLLRRQSGMVSWFVKQALLNIAGDLGLKFKEPKTREDWAGLPRRRASRASI